MYDFIYRCYVCFRIGFKLQVMGNSWGTWTVAGSRSASPWSLKTSFVRDHLSARVRIHSLRSFSLLSPHRHRRHRRLCSTAGFSGGPQPQPASPILLPTVLVLAQLADHLTPSSHLSYNSHSHSSNLSPSAPCQTEAMMGFLTSAVGATKRPRGVSVGEEIPEDTEPDDTSILYVSSTYLPPSIPSYPSPSSLPLSASIPLRSCS